MRRKTRRGGSCAGCKANWRRTPPVPRVTCLSPVSSLGVTGSRRSSGSCKPWACDNVVAARRLKRVSKADAATATGELVMKLREEKARRTNTGEEPRLEGGQSSARRTAAGVPGCQGDGTGAGRRSRKRPACRTIHSSRTDSLHTNDHNPGRHCRVRTGRAKERKKVLKMPDNVGIEPGTFCATLRLTTEPLGFGNQSLLSFC